MGFDAISLQAFFALLGSNDQKFDEFIKNPATFISKSDLLSNDDKFFLLTMGPANRDNRIVYSFNFSQDQIEMESDDNGQQVFRISGNQHNIQKGDRVQLPHIIEGSINLDTFELKLDIKHGVIDATNAEEDSLMRIHPDTSVVYSLAFNKNNIRLLNGDFVILGNQNNIDVVTKGSENEIADLDAVAMLPHRINGSFDEKSNQLSLSVFLDNPEA